MDVSRGDLDGVERRPLGGDITAIAVVGGQVAAGYARLLEQSTRTHGQRGRDHLVGVDNDTPGRIGADRGVHAVETAVRPRLLGDDVDGAARGASAGVG